ncbi:Zn(2)-C6 fungal-type domain-containing protein [Mycena kentingensis (nom. inval.)]|nr:Zn(2)-C6 fungal-type domain-containing protein [Mycena kentingensis (nom. inval.)]
MSDSDPPTKKRRVQRACDNCRLKRRACDGLKLQEKQCTNCKENGLDCTFTGAETKRKSYVDVLEARLELSETLLRKLGSGNPPPPTWSPQSPITTHKSTAIPPASLPGPGVELAALTIRSMNTPAPAPHEDDLAHIELTRDLGDLSIDSHSERFHGKSSGAMLVKATVLAREGYEEKEMPWNSRRMHYWTYNPAKHRKPHVGPFIFPPRDLLESLISLYFDNTNIYYPLLHRPTFLRSVFTDALHTTNTSFGAIVLLVCAIGARFSKDERVCPPGVEPLRVGWEFFDQLPLIIEHLFVRPTVYHLQFYCLATTFLEFSAPASCWTLVGIGIRLAQDVGAHRLQNFSPGAKPTVEGELWKRAFWVLICMDRQISSSLGRPCTTQYEDFDAELPIEVDDEFWEVPESTEFPSIIPGEPPVNTAEPTTSRTESSGTTLKNPPAFSQPPGRPSTIAFFNCLIRLNNILGFSLHLLYGLSKAKTLLSHRDDAWEEHIVAELDSALNGWVDSIPPHLRWDPNRPRTLQDDLWFSQSALLYSHYYSVQMTIHRPFIPAVRKGAPTSLPSLAICTNAARSSSHVIETSRLRNNGTPVPVLLTPAFTAGLVLLLNVWSGKRTGLPPHMNSAIFEVHKCMAAIEVCEKRWQSAGLFRDLLYELASIGHLPLPNAVANTAEPQHAAQNRNDSEPFPEPQNPPAQAQTEQLLGGGAAVSIVDPDQSQELIPPMVYIPLAAQAPRHAVMGEQVGNTRALPTYSGDLGRLPVFHQQLGMYSAQPQPSDVDVNGLSNFMPSTSGSTSSWYPEQTSMAPFGYPHFTTDASDGVFGADASALANGEEVFEEASRIANAAVPELAAPEGGEGLTNEEIAMWANAPLGFEVNDWDSYFSTLHENSKWELPPLLALALAVLGQDTSIAEVKKAFCDANIPENLSITFEPRALLEVALPQATGPPIILHAGIQVPREDTAGPPTFSVSGNTGPGPFVIAAVDPDAPTPQAPTSAQIRHFLGGDFTRSRGGLLTNSTPAISPFRQPTPPAGSDAHRYIFLLFRQSSEWATQTLVNSTTPVQLFNISSFADAVNLGDPIAGTFMLVAPPATSAA